MSKNKTKPLTGARPIPPPNLKLEKESKLSGISSDLQELTDRLRICTDLRIKPAGSRSTDIRWPSSRTYRDILKNICLLDQKKNRHKAHPAWNQSIANVNRNFPKAKLKRRITRFIKWANEQVPRGKEVPRMVSEAAKTYPKSHAEVREQERDSILVRIARIAQGIIRADGSKYQYIQDHYSSKTFRDHHKKATSSRGEVLEQWHPLLEYAAALDAFRHYQEFMGLHYKWLRDLADFLKKLESTEFSDTSERIKTILGGTQSIEDVLKTVKRTQGKARTKRSRGNIGIR